MSTRRARIKAVTSLPPRRKNNVLAENKAKETAEKTIKSPRTPSDVNKSPRTKNVTESKTLESIPHNAEKLISLEKPASSSVTVENLSKATTPIVPRTPEKGLDIKRNSSNVFASPALRASPRKAFASPIAPSPKVSKTSDLQRSGTPQRETSTTHKISDSNELQIAETTVSRIDHNVKSKKDTGKDDYSIPSVPESTDDEAMDGIVPLKPAASVPKPIDVLKNEIISENAEVLFDPIVPLPSPSKVRPKLRPVPRLAPLRRNSVQGSASESEDENRRSLLNAKDRQAHDVHTLQSLPNRDVSRVRNDSICSNMSQMAAQPGPCASPAREKQQMNKSRRQEEARRRMAMRQRRQNAKREARTMYDLIFYNPTSNPLVLSEDEIKLKEAKEKQLEVERVAEEKQAAVKPTESPNKTDEPAPVPQIKLGPKGEIILDEQSLVIKQTESDRCVSSVVHEGAWGSGGQYRTRRRGAGWSASETVRFYRAVAALGTDFTLMAEVFPDRTRKQLKLKFKKEEKMNPAQIDKALRATLEFDVTQLEAEFVEEREEAAREAELEREQLNMEKQAERVRLRAAKETGLRRSRGLKAMEICREPVHKNWISPDDIIEHHYMTKMKSKQKAPPKIPKMAPVALVRSLSKFKEDTANNRTTNKPSLQTDSPSLQTNTPSLQKPSLQTNTPSLHTNTPSLQTNTPSLQTNTPSMQTKTQSLQTNTPSLQKPSLQTNTPSLHTNTPSLQTNTPSLQTNTPSLQTKTPSLQTKTPEATNALQIPANIETGSLVVLTVNDPSSPAKKMLQTYIANGPGKLTPVALPPTILNYVVGYMKKGTPKGSNQSSPLLSPSSVASVDSHNSAPTGVTVLPSPAKRQRHSSYTITQL